jgi:hypothetical protein
MSRFVCLLLLLLGAWVDTRAQALAPAGRPELVLSRDSARQFFGTYEFEPRFQMQIFSQNGQLFAQRLGDNDKFQLFAARPALFFLKAMPAELEFVRAASGQYETLVLHQGGRDKTAHRLQAQPYELYDEVLKLDAQLYQAYNQQQLAAFMAYFSPQLEFYHDQTGVTTYQDNLQRFKENFAKPAPLRRELVPGSLEVYPIAGFGAIEIGVHRFYQHEQGQPERVVAEPRFLHVWQHKGDKWLITRIISYDH